MPVSTTVTTYPDTAFLEATVRRMGAHRAVHGAILCAQSGDGRLSWRGASGNLDADGRFFIASVTKMMVTVVMLRLRDEGRVDLDHPMARYLGAELISGLHVAGGVDRTDQITLRHLMSNTSGLTDYFFGKGPDGRSAGDSLLRGNDEAWPLERIVARARTLKPRFLPGQPGKVHYSDTNYELLGRVIETVTGSPIADVLDDVVFRPLGLRETYAFSDPSDVTPAPMYYRDTPVHMPKYIASITAEGGVVSTAAELMAFLKAFFDGTYFPPQTIEELTRWNRIYFPGQFDFGVGLERQWLPWVLSPFRPLGDLLGFWGQSGAFAFHNPQRDLFFTGTVNQLSGFGHGAAVSAMVRVMKATR